MKVIRCWQFAWITLLVLCSVAIAQAQTHALTVIELRYRRADELIPVLKPIVAKDTTLTGIDYKLIVRSDDHDLRRIREALAVLDQAPKQLLLSVRSATSGDIEAEHAQITGQVGSDTQLTLSTGSNSTNASGNSTNTLHVSEGQSAYIVNGQLVPFVSGVVGGVVTQSGTSTQPGTLRNNNNGGLVVFEQRQVGTGIHVLPRVSGNEVIVDIEVQQDRMRGDNVAVNHTVSQINGKLGQWLPLSATEIAANQQLSTLGGTTTRTANDQRTIWIKVELLSE
jgi:type II secretory pathway component GspD/PulD (secretin)